MFMRLFVSIPLSTDLREILEAAVRPLAETRADIRWVPAENLHITLKFIGEVEEACLPELLARITRAASEVPVFPLEIEGVEKMPEKGPVRIIKARVISPDQRIAKLHRLIDSACGGMGLPLDTRVYVPHLTLGRVSSNHGLNRLLRRLERHHEDHFGTLSVEQVTLCHSLLGAGENGAPRYVVVGTAHLAAPAAKPAR
jgi:2'-5' RNA ligase